MRGRSGYIELKSCIEWCQCANYQYLFVSSVMSTVKADGFPCKLHSSFGLVLQ